MSVLRSEGVGNHGETAVSSAQSSEERSPLDEALRRAERAERRVRELENTLAQVRGTAEAVAAGAGDASGTDRTALLEAVFDAMTDGVVVYDRDGRMLHTNRANRDILGNEAAWKDYFARPIEERLDVLRFRDEAGNPLPYDQWPHLRVLRGEVLANGTAMRVLARDLNGRDKHLIITGAPVRDATGELIGAVCIHRDVTERRRLHDEAERRASQLQAIFDAITDGLYVYDAQGRLIETNAAVSEYDPIASAEGYRAQAFAERIQDIQPRDRTGNPFPVDELPVSRILRGDTLRSQSTVDTLIHARDGRETYFNVSGAPMRDAAGQIVGAVMVTRDVTERLRAEREYAQQARLLDAIFEAVPERVSLFDAQGRLIRMNSAAQRESGPQRGGEGLDEFQASYDLRRLDGSPYPTQELPLQRSLRGETVTNVEMLFRAGDGSDQVIVTNSAPIRDHAGRVVGAVSITHDVTERRRLERRTRESLDALLEMAQLLVQPDAAGAPAEGHVRPAQENTLAYRLATLTCRVLGCTRVSISVVEPETQLLKPLTVVGMSPEDTRAWFQEQSEQATRLGEGADPDLMRRFMAGDVLVLDLTRPPYDALPNPYQLTTILTVAMRVGEQVVGQLALDHSGVKHQFTTDEIQLAQAVAQLAAWVVERDRLVKDRADAEAQLLALAETNRRMSEFLSIASHELRTPLTSAIANSQLARRQVQKLDGRDRGNDQTTIQRLHWLVERTEQQLQRQSRLVTDLLDVSRIQVGSLEMDLQPLDLLAVVRDCVEEQRLAHPHRTLSLRTASAPARLMVEADADRIGQVLTNLLTNALKYSPPWTAVRVSVSARRGMARVQVSDRGPGLPPEEHEAIWEQFHRAPGIEVQSGSGIGLGIGLFISRTIVERHGGAVGLKSAPGKGSTFWFEIPCREGVRPTGENEAEAAALPS